MNSSLVGNEHIYETIPEFRNVSIKIESPVNRRPKRERHGYHRRSIHIFSQRFASLDSSTSTSSSSEFAENSNSSSKHDQAKSEY